MANRTHTMHVAKPTRAQADAGNYRMSHINLQGLAISVETPKGRRRRPEWPPMAAHYGYIKGTLGRDGDHLDVFIGPNRSSELVFVIDQSGASGKRFDEHKIMLGFDSRQQAIAAYRASYRPGWTVGPVSAMTMEQLKNWIRLGNQTKPVASQVSRYSADNDDLYLAPESAQYEVEHYKWQAAEHPRHDAGAPDGIGGQFAPTGETKSGNAGGGGYTPFKPLSPSEAAQLSGHAPASVAKPSKSTRLREIAALPDNVKQGHALHLSALSNRDRADLMDWSRRLHEAMAKVEGPNEEAEWQNVNKNYIRAMLDEMNARDRAGRERGVRLSDYINANGLIPEALAARLQGGKRFFDPEHIRDKLKSGAPSPEVAKAAADAETKRKSVINEFKFGSRDKRKAMISTPGEIQDILHRAMGLIPLSERKRPPAPAAEQVKEPLPTPELVKKEPENFISPKPSTAESLFATLSKAHQKKVDAAIKGDDTDMPSDMVADLREVVLNTWKQMTAEAQSHNDALRQVMSGAHSTGGGSWGIISARLAKGDDPAKIKGFDQMVDFAKNHFPQLLSHHRGSADTGSDEEGLVQALKQGLKSIPNPWDQEVIQTAQEQLAPVGVGVGESFPSYPDDPNDPEYVPFSVQSIVAEVMRYWNDPATRERFCA